MKINAAKYLKGITGTDPLLYDGKFQVAFMGRSNVGKSSLINSLVPQRSLARTSRSPGKTLRMDFFLVNNQFYFVDFPGYGFAKVPGKMHDKLRKMILWYLMYSEVKNRLVILIIDIKIGLTEYDKTILDILNEMRISYLLIANKSDKLKKQEREKQLKITQQDAGNAEIIIYSTKENYGRDQLLGRIFSGLNR